MDENYLITGYHGVPHVTAENDRGINAATFGPGRFVLPTGQQFRAEYIGNNTIRLYDGKLMDNGAAAGIPAGRYIDLLIPEAGQGKNRNDLIVFQYSKDSATLVESGSFVVVRGVETDGTAEDPALSQADLLTDAATFDQMALWRIPVSATVISDPVQLFEVSDNIQTAGNPARYVIQAESSDGVQYSATLDGVASIFPGLTITIILNMASTTTAPKLNVNGWGAKTIRRRVSGYTALTIAGSSDDWLVANKPISVTYNGTYWLLDDVRPSASDLYGVLPIEKGGTGATEPSAALAALGGLEVVDATLSTNDMDVYLSNGSHLAMFRTGSNTKGTPYAKGVTTFNNALILSYRTNNYGTQVAFVSGDPKIYTRTYNNGTISNWTAIT